MEFIKSNSYSLIISSRIHGKEGREGRQGDEEKEKIVKSNKHICLRKGLKLSTFFFFFWLHPWHTKVPGPGIEPTPEL